jgi:hypothetical protein
MTSISNTGSAFLQSLPTTGNWMLDAVSANNSDWMDPSSSGPDAVNLAANAFAQAETATTGTLNSLAVNKGIATLQTKLAASEAGQTVNIFA